MNSQPISGLSGDALSERGRSLCHTRSSSWIGGALLIGTGMLLLLQHMHISGYRCLALFMLIPTVSAFSKAWDAYQGAGHRLTAQARSSLAGGILLYLIAALLLFGQSGAFLGLAAVLLIGVSLAASGLLAWPR